MSHGIKVTAAHDVVIENCSVEDVVTDLQRRVIELRRVLTAIRHGAVFMTHHQIESMASFALKSDNPSGEYEHE